MRSALLTGVVATGGACRLVSPDLSRVIALEIVVKDSVAVAETLRARAIPITAGGDSTGGTVYWTSFDTTTLAVADSARGIFVGRAAGGTSVQARLGNIASAAIPVTVTAAAGTSARASRRFAGPLGP